MTATTGWVCKVCWKWNRPEDDPCYKCRSPRGITEDAEVEVHRKALEAKAAEPEPVPDIVVALPVWVFRGYARVWLRGGIGLLGLLALMAFGGVTDLIWFALTAGFSVALVVCGFLAGEVADGMRNREVWAFVTGIVLSVVAVIGSITAFSVFAPGLVNPTAVRWGSLIVFGGAGVAAAGGLVMLIRASRGSPQQR
ncbi:MAG TPA: hypothetical protein VFJ03_05275 [Candidatus Limnocylindria bacterium]|jgi:hypothetical protein|nr:hypothetical protein [Candidatus Limnocylindria bacterium]